MHNATAGSVKLTPKGASDRGRGGLRWLYGHLWLPCVHDSHDGACEQACLVDKSASRVFSSRFTAFTRHRERALWRTLCRDLQGILPQEHPVKAKRWSKSARL